MPEPAMSVLSGIWRRLKKLGRREQLDRDLDEEMRLHLELRQQRLMERGLTPAQAKRAAHIKFGNPVKIKEASRMNWGSELMESLMHDVRYGTRALLRSPGLTVVALLSLALGIGANSAIFSLLDAVLLRSLPVHKPEQLVLLGLGDESGIGDNFVSSELYSYPFYRQLQQRNTVFSDVAAVASMTNDVHGTVVGPSGQSGIDSVIMHVQLVSGSYFPALGVQPHLGRLLAESDDVSEGDHPVVVISQGFWKRALAQDPNVLRRQLKLGSSVFNIVGVAPAEFFGTTVGESPEMWVPLSMTKAVPPGWDFYRKDFVQTLHIIGRLKPGVTLAAATSQVNLLLQQITRGFGDADLSQKNLAELNKTHVQLTPIANGLSSIRAKFSRPLQVLMAVVALVLLIACANIANLLLARSTAHARELAVRQALGARRLRIVRQLLTESLLLALAGGAIGIALAGFASRLLVNMVSPGDEPLPLHVGVDPRLLAFTFAITIATAVVFGTLPALRATRLQLTDSLKEGRGPTNANSRGKLARILIVGQVALSLVLMVAAILFLRSLNNLSRVDPGFNRESVLRLQLDTQPTGMDGEDPRLVPLFQQIEARVNALPGVIAASFSAFTFHEGTWAAAVLVPGMPGNEDYTVHQNVVGNRYFETMQIPLVAGRTFGPQDTATSPRVAVLSEHVARVLFPPGNPIGRHFHLGKDEPAREFEVIGVVKDVKLNALDEAPKYISYLSYAQRPWGFGDFEVRYTGNFTGVAHDVQQAIHSIDRTLLITHVTSLDEQIARTVNDQRMVAQLSSFFGLLAVFLSCIGIYGLMSYAVNRRTNEIGIRMALGASRNAVRWLVLREITGLVVVGVAIGVPLTILSSRLVRSMLFGLAGADAPSLLASTALLLAVAIVAGYLPALRASRVDPMVALRYE